MEERGMSAYHLTEYLQSIFENFGQQDQEILNMLEEYQKTELWPLVEAYKQNSALQIKRFADEMPGGFFIYRADGNEELLYANHAMANIFGCDSMKEFREWVGNSFCGIVHPDDLEEVERSIVEQIRNSQFDLDYVEYRIIRKDGEVRWVEDYGHFVHNGEGGIFYVFISDATEKKNRLMEERLAWQNESMRREEEWKNQIQVYSQELETISLEHLRRLEVIEGLSVDYASIFYLDLQQDWIRVYRLGPLFRPQFAQTDHLSGIRKCFDTFIDTWVHPEDRALVRKITGAEYIRRKLSDRNTIQNHYRILVEGKEAYQQLYIVNVGKETQVAQVVMGFRNVDSEVRHELEHRRVLETTLEQAKAANIARNTFLANMSHDLRTPMNAIAGFTELARRHKDDPEKVGEYLDKIEESGRLLLQLLSDVLEFTKIESDQIHIEEQACSLPEIVDNVCAAALSRARLRGISLSSDISGLTHTDVCADRDKLEEVLIHLVYNAIKYTLRGGSVLLTAEEVKRLSADYAVYRFVVQDTGIGIGKDFLPYVFEPFEREKNTTLSGVQGTGLGLAITRNIVDRMGGIIEVASEVDHGSRFTVTLSLRLNHAERSEENHGGNTLERLKKGQKILLVEDNEINREIEVELLCSVGFRVDTASDGSIAVNMIKASQPGEYALILMDIQMPVMDGHQAAQAIRKLPEPYHAGIPIVALSANAFDEDRKRSMKSGMNAHLAKPVDMDRLIELIGEI